MGMTLIEMRAQLRLDLKDASTTWSDPELNRSVERAVNDLSRYMPLERVYEHTLDFTITDEAITSPATTSLTAVVNAQSINVAAGNYLTIAGQPDVPRKLTITITDADSSTYEATFLVIGTDKDGVSISETFHYSRGKSKTLVGTKEFKTVYTVELDNDYGSGAGDTASIGYGLSTDAWISLANRPIRPKSEVVTTSPAGTTYTRDTDYTMDYANGRIKPKSGGSMAAATAYLVDYTKSRLGVDINAILPVVTRIQKVEYPMNQVPQKFPSFNIIGDFMYIGSPGVGSSQAELTDKEHLAIYYEMKHDIPGEVGPGSYPDVLDEVVLIGSGGHALLIEAQQYEQAAATAITSLNSALTNVIKYLNNNSSVDLAGLLQDITDDAASLRTALTTAVDAANAYLDDVDTTDLGKASVGAEAYTETGDDKIDAVNIGALVAENYATYSGARVNIANARITAALGYIQEATTRLANLRTYIEQAGGYSQLAQGFVAEAQLRAESVNGNLVLSDRFRTEGLNRLAEFHQILKSKAEYRKRVVSTSVKQPA